MSIIGPLPFVLTNGTVANADEVMADLQFIVDQTNVNAQQTGSALTAGLEWTLLAGTPSYISATSFVMSGDQTATFIIGRRVKSVNTGGTTYSTVLSSVVTLNTTVTVVNTSGVLDSGLSAVSIGTLNAVNQSLPLVSYVSILAQCTLAAAALTPLSISGTASDNLSEWSATKFTPRVAATYLFTFIGGELGTNGVDVTAASNFQMGIYLNGSGSGTGLTFCTPFGSGVQSSTALISASQTVPMVVGDYAEIKAIFQTFTGVGPMLLLGGRLVIQRLLY